MRGFAWCSGLLLLACSAENPAYDEPRSTTTQGSGTQGGSGVLDDGLDGSTTIASGMCDLHDENWLRMEIEMGGIRAVPDCRPGFELRSTPVSRIQYPPPDLFQLTACADNQCGDCQGSETAVDFQGSLVMPPGLPNCGRLTAWAGMGPDGCEWQGVMLQAGDELLPVFVASNSRAVLPLGAFSLGLSSDVLCRNDEGCSTAPGRHALVVINEEVTVEDSPVTVPVAFVQGGVSYPYEVHNRMSSITRDCEEQVSWTALLAEG